MRPNSIKSLDNSLFVEDVSLLDIVKKYPTPFYIYSKEMILAAIDSYLTNIRERDLVCYSVKANSNLAILKIMAEKGMGFDVVSGGELFKVLKIGADPQKIIYSGVGKTKPELEYAVDNDIKSINIESHFELELLNQIGKEKITYKLRDWGVSRQRYWGCPIPVIYYEDGSYRVLEKSELPVLLPYDVNLESKGNSLLNLDKWRVKHGYNYRSFGCEKNI